MWRGQPGVVAMKLDFTPNVIPPETSQESSATAASKSKKRFDWLELARPLANRRIAIGAIAAIVAAIVVAIIWKNNFDRASATTGEPPPVVTVATAPAEFKPISHSLEVTGSIWAWDPLSLGSEVSGLRIAAVNVEEGDLVKKGEVLATLNSSVLKAQLDQARARLSSSKTNLRKSVQPNRREDIQALRAALSQAKATIAQQEATLLQAEANLENAENNARRFADLVKQGAVSQVDFESKQTLAITARAEVSHRKEAVRAAHFAWQQAKERLSMAEVGGRREDIEISQAAVAEQEATVDQLAAQLEQTIIRAPTDGLVIKRNAHIGDITAAGKPLFMLMRNNRMELRAQVPEADLPRIHVGQPVKLVSYADPSLKLAGSVREISPLVDSTSRLGTVRIDVPSQPDVRPGMFVRGIVDLGEHQALTVPAKAVLNRDGLLFVFTLSGKQARRRSVQAGTYNAGVVEIVAGIKPGEIVITDGAGFLKDGDFVRVGQ